MVFMQLNQRVTLKDFASTQVKTNLDPRKCSIRFYLNGCKGNLTWMNVIWDVDIFVFAYHHEAFTVFFLTFFNIRRIICFYGIVLNLVLSLTTRKHLPSLLSKGFS